MTSSDMNSVVDVDRRARRRPSRGVALLSTLLLASGSLCCGAEPPEAALNIWQHLPAETAVALRCPDGQAVVDAMVNDTRLGAVLLSPERRQIVTELLAAELESQPNDEQDNPLQALAGYGFEPGDVATLLEGESGYAMLVPREDDESLMPVGIGWLTPGEELADRVFTAIGEAIEERSDREHPVRRVDTEIAGRTVMQLSLPYFEYEHPDEYNLPDDFHELEGEERQAALQRAREEYLDAIVITAKEMICLVASTEGRLVACHAYASLHDTPVEEQVARTAATLTQLLSALDDANSSDGWIASAAEHAEIESVLHGAGHGIVELFVDSQGLIRMGPREGAEAEAFQQSIRVGGLAGCGPFAVRIALDGPGMVSTAVLITEAPRQGLLRLLDQPATTATPPAWVPSDAVTYSKLSLDLGAAVDVVRSEIEKEFGDESAASFQMFDAQTEQFTGVGPEALFASLGTLLHVVQFETEIEDGDPSEETFSPFNERQAFVWDLKDSQPWTKLLSSLQPLAAMGGGFKLTEEQGFRGYRLEQGDLHMAVFLGNKHLVWVIGEGVITPTLALLNNPPDGKDRFAESPLYSRARSLLDISRCNMLEISDGQRSLQTGVKMLRLVLSGFDGDDASESAERWADAADKLLPTASEAEDLAGAAVGTWEIDQRGVRIRSVIELPRP
ncbi:hypothetical protein OAS39_03105 [Pirellulales bacterium]|nr:hypothetical protein [Pirellulales bacterium]